VTWLNGSRVQAMTRSLARRPPRAAACGALMAICTGALVLACSGANNQPTSPLGPGVKIPAKATWVGQGNFKICKVAGQGVAVGTMFTFTVLLDGSIENQTFTVSAGAGPTGTCVLDATLFSTGTDVTITETAHTGTHVTAIVVSPSGNVVISPNLTTRSVTVKAGSAQTTTVTFTNAQINTGCTLTQGFYKNHESVVASLLTKSSIYTLGGKLLIGGTGLTASQIVTILETAPAGGSTVLILEHQLIAAELNIIGGASAPANVTAAITQAATVLASGLGSTSLADLLDRYNSGLIGPGHCND
jgi:hypothetical protein